MVGEIELQITADGDYNRLLVGFLPGNYPLHFSVPDFSGLAQQITQRLAVDQPRAVYFAVANEAGTSNEVRLTLTARRTPKPVPPVLSSVSLTVPMSDDDPDYDYYVEVTP